MILDIFKIHNLIRINLPVVPNQYLSVRGKGGRQKVKNEKHITG